MKKRTSVKDFFDARAKSYKKVSNWTMNEDLNQKTDELLKDISGDIAIELGSGIGILISRLKNFKRKIALDISKEMLSEIQDKSIEKTIGDIHNLEFPNNYFDLIICRQLLHYCILDVAFQNIKKVLKTEGYVHIVQVVEFENVPESWDQQWVDLRNVNIRKHSRTKELEECFAKFSLRTIKTDTLIIRDNYLWQDFFEKHNVAKEDEKRVKIFFVKTPKHIKNEIGMEINENSISYNRIFKLWLLKSY